MLCEISVLDCALYTLYNVGNGAENIRWFNFEWMCRGQGMNILYVALHRADRIWLINYNSIYFRLLFVSKKKIILFPKCKTGNE